MNSSGNVAITFLLGCLGFLALTIWRMKSLAGSISLWFGLSCVLGLLGLFVPFGEVSVALGGGRPQEFTGFCGEGVPIPFVIWDKGADYPNPLALFMNPICVFIVGLVLIVLANGLFALYRRIRAKP
jgi:hypothetical protein